MWLGRSGNKRVSKTTLSYLWRTARREQGVSYGAEISGEETQVQYSNRNSFYSNDEIKDGVKLERTGQE
jgi:hypothetical protein